MVPLTTRRIIGAPHHERSPRGQTAGSSLSST
jgi:hypothetical protein